MQKLTFKSHLRVNLIICVFIYICVSITQKSLFITEYSDFASSCLGAGIFLLNFFYYILRYLEGDFTEKEDYFNKYSGCK